MASKTSNFTNLYQKKSTLKLCIVKSQTVKFRPNLTICYTNLTKQRVEKTQVVITKVLPTLSIANENRNGGLIKHRFTGTKINGLVCLY